VFQQNFVQGQVAALSLPTSRCFFTALSPRKIFAHGGNKKVAIKQKFVRGDSAVKKYRVMGNDKVAALI